VRGTLGGLGVAKRAANLALLLDPTAMGEDTTRRHGAYWRDETGCEISARAIGGVVEGRKRWTTNFSADRLN
jgi:hypothetical protein